jgi:hypothetical protein
LGPRHPPAACDRRVRRGPALVVVALLGTLGFSGSAAPRPARSDVSLGEARLHVAAMPTGAVGLSPAGKESGSGNPMATCQYNYPQGECEVIYSAPVTVTLTAEPGAGQTFYRWSAADCGTGPTCSVPLADGVEPPQVWALFTPASLTVLIAGEGTVSGAGGAIACDPAQLTTDCGESLAAGTTVQLTATPKTPGVVVTWVFGCDPGDSANVPTCDARPENRYVGVRFGSAPGPAPPFDVDVRFRVATVGSGSVTGGAINCGSTCAATVGFGARLKLSATPASGSRFDHWEGAPCSTQPSCALNAGPVTSVRAVFEALPLPPPPPTTTTTTTTDHDHHHHHHHHCEHDHHDPPGRPEDDNAGQALGALFGCELASRERPLSRLRAR